MGLQTTGYMNQYLDNTEITGFTLNECVIGETCETIPEDNAQGSTTWDSWRSKPPKQPTYNPWKLDRLVPCIVRCREYGNYVYQPTECRNDRSNFWFKPNLFGPDRGLVGCYELRWRASVGCSCED